YEIFKGLKSNHTLIIVNLNYNSIQGEVFSYLLDMLKSNSSLEQLHLDGNMFEDKDTKLIAELITSESYLKTLSLRSSNIKKEEIIKIAKLSHGENKELKLCIDNHYVRAAELAQNRIEREETTGITRLIDKSKELKLDVGNDHISAEKSEQLFGNSASQNPDIIESIESEDVIILGESIKYL
ncbi:MAG: hypothetical protein ACRYE9_03870, partial [Janthinobacterium lividum]